MAARVGISRLQRIGEGEQAVKERALEAEIGLPQIGGVAERLPMGRPQPMVGRAELALARLGGLVHRPQVARVREGLGESYVSGHEGLRGSRLRTSANS